MKFAIVADILSPLQLLQSHAQAVAGEEKVLTHTYI